MRRLLALFGLCIAVTGAAAAQDVFVNELHYDNDGTDSGEAIEIAGPAGTDLTGWSVVLYNGSNGSVYDTDDLGGTIPNEQNGFGTVALTYPSNGLQNGSPDGLALVDASGSVVQFLSYEGSFAAVGGPADGLTSTDIGVAETSSTPVGFSLQLTGTGASYTDFAWTGPADDSFGAVNAGQAFTGTPSVSDPLLNEFVANHTGADDYEFVEVVGDPATDYAAFTILEVEGDGSGAGTIDGVFPVGATDAAGYWTTGYQPNAVENGTVTLLLVEGFTGAAGDDLDADDDGTLDAQPWTRLVDGVAVSDGGTDQTYAVALAPGFDGAPFTVGGASRIPDGTDTDAAADWTRNDFDGDGLPGFTGAADPAEAVNTPGAENRLGEPAFASSPFINELHYDNDGGDTGEAVEVAGAAGTDLTGWSVVLYNGNGGSAYDTIPLTGTLADQCGGFGTVVASGPSFQNGSPDGLALVDASGSVVQFLSYEGSFAAVGGPADGLTSTDIGVAETSSTPVGFSLQLTGDGTEYADFAWAEAGEASFGSPNAAQTFDGVACGPPNTPPAFTTVLAATDVPAGAAFTFDYDATDDDGDPLAFSLLEGPGDVDAATGVFTWTPAEAQVGTTVTVRVAVSDGRGGTDETSAALTVVSGNAPPVFTSALASGFVDAGTAVTFDYDATDEEGDPFTYTLVDAPAGATLDPTTGVFAWTPSTPGVYAVTVGAGSTTTTAVIGAQGVLFAGESGSTLRESLRAAYAPDGTLGYDVARDVMYGEIDRDAEGDVTGVYSGFSVFLPLGVDPSTYLFDDNSARSINAEHTWPQSLGAGDEPARSDIHNLFPAKATVNSARSNKPYGEIPDALTETWYREAETSETIPTEDLDAWSESAPSFFEPREVHKGNAARAALYFYAIYEGPADEGFLLQQKATLLDWAALDPADAEELVRTYEISLYQGNVNPLLIDPTLAARLVDDVLPPTPPATRPVAEVRAEADGTLVTVEGIVTRAEGRFIRLQDATAGITVFEAGGFVRQAVETGAIRAGDRLRITGTLDTFNGLLEIVPTLDLFEVVSRGNPLPAPQRVTLAELEANGEAYESELVLVTGLTIDPAGDEVFADNTTYTVTDPTGTGDLRTPGAADTRIEGTPIPSGDVYFVGVLGEFRGTYQLQPVAEGDVAVDTSAPAITLAQDEVRLWPPNKKYHSFDVTDLVAGVDDGLLGAIPVDRVVVTSVTSDEPAGRGKASTPIVVGDGCGSVALQADRDGRGDGRVYTVHLAVTDGSGNTGSAAVRVTVPHDQRPGASAVDSGVALTVPGCAPEAGSLAMQPAPGAPALAADAAEETPDAFALEGSYPNPFNPQTTIRFALPEAVHVRLTVFDVTGREVRRLVDAVYEAGHHNVVFGAEDLPSGTYLYRIQAGAFADTGRMVLVK